MSTESFTPSMTQIIHVCAELLIIVVIVVWLNNKINTVSGDTKLIKDEMSEMKTIISNQHQILQNVCAIIRPPTELKKNTLRKAPPKKVESSDKKRVVKEEKGVKEEKKVGPSDTEEKKVESSDTKDESFDDNELDEELKKDDEDEEVEVSV